MDNDIEYHKATFVLTQQHRRRLEVLARDNTLNLSAALRLLIDDAYRKRRRTVETKPLGSDRVAESAHLHE